MKPGKRSPLRITLGRLVYTWRRYWEWYLGGVRFARQVEKELLPWVCYRHKTPLLRKLRQVDMWLQYNKIKNLELAVEKIDGVVLHPGETFSYWRLIGKPSRRKGYVEGMVLFCGQVRTGVGGGLCQLSNLLYWLALHTPLVVTERWRHSYDVFPDVNRRQPFGSGATCAYNYLDLRLFNPTNQPFQVHVYLTDGELVGEWRTIENPGLRYEVYEREHWINQEFWGDYVRHNRIFRKVFDQGGRLLEDQFLTENHAIMMYPPFLEAGKTGSAGE